MNLYTCHIYGSLLVHYFSNDENVLKWPYVWIREQSGRYSVCGSSMFLDHFLPRRKETKDSKKAFSMLAELQKVVDGLTIKEKIKLCIVQPSGKEFEMNTIYKNNLSYRKFVPTKKELKNENGKK